MVLRKSSFTKSVGKAPNGLKKGWTFWSTDQLKGGKTVSSAESDEEQTRASSTYWLYLVTEVFPLFVFLKPTLICEEF